MKENIQTIVKILQNFTSCTSRAIEKIMDKLNITTSICYVGSKCKYKPFDLKAAMAGKPVCTRDGCKARIICFDKKNDEYPIVTLVTKGKEEYIFQYTNKGEYIKNCKTFSYNNLVMLVEKEEGYVNVYEKTLYKTEKEAKEHVATGLNYLRTVKVEWEE